MDGENNGSKPYEQMDDLGGFPIFLETSICIYIYTLFRERYRSAHVQAMGPGVIPRPRYQTHGEGIGRVHETLRWRWGLLRQSYSTSSPI